MDNPVVLEGASMPRLRSLIVSAFVAGCLSASSALATVSLYTIKIDPSTPRTTYILETYSQPGTGWVGTSPSFTESPFSTQASMQLKVPEPTGVGLAGLIGLLAGARRRRQSA